VIFGDSVLVGYTGAFAASASAHWDPRVFDEALRFLKEAMETADGMCGARFVDRADGHLRLFCPSISVFRKVFARISGYPSPEEAIEAALKLGRDDARGREASLGFREREEAEEEEEENEGGFPDTGHVRKSRRTEESDDLF
jgi:hypothetical protein